MAKPCGSYIGHEECNFIFPVTERKDHKAPSDAWKNSKNKSYKKKIAAQSK